MAMPTLLLSQMSIGGNPMSYVHPELITDEDVMELILNTPDIQSLLSVDASGSRSDAVWRDAVAVNVDAGINTISTGTWYNLEEDGKVWKLKLSAPEALSLELNFDEFFLPAGSSIYIYNPEHTEHIGGFTSINNKVTGRFSSDMIQGESCIIEYHEPIGTVGSPLINVQDVTFRYRDLLKLEDGGGSQVCEVDVSCIEGAPWQDQNNSVVRIRTRIGSDFFWSSGVLVNNSSLNCKPYILSSLRTTISSIDGSSSLTEDYQNYRFYFNYKRGECGQGSGGGQSLTGCFFRASSNDNGGLSGSDFILLELTEDIPLSYNAYYAGWNVQANPNTTNGVSIHHPMGDVKKISTFISAPSSANWGIDDTHWKVEWSETVSGIGVTEIGSNGAPLFDSNGLVIGTLTGGSSNCDEVIPGGTENPDYFGKISRHWMDNPNPLFQKLRNWLDPVGLSTLTFEGSYNPCAVGIDVSEIEEHVTVFPNPSSEILNITFGNSDYNGTVNVIDITGKILISQEINSYSMFSIHTNKLSQGIYFLHFLSEKSVNFSKKFVVKR